MLPSPVPAFHQPALLLLVLGGLLFFFRLGVPGLMDPDEGRYAEIAREMLVLGDFVTPRLNFLPYLEKPPLVYWLTALSLSVGGLNEWAARFIPALSALGGIMAVYWLALKLWGPGNRFPGRPDNGHQLRLFYYRPPPHPGYDPHLFHDLGYRPGISGREKPASAATFPGPIWLWVWPC